jgi:hypothetical protein
MSAPAFRLKGGGWYETDFKGDKDKQRNIAGDKEPVVEKAKEDKPAAPAAAKPGDAAKAEPAVDKPKADVPKPPPARKIKTRRRVRK